MPAWVDPFHPCFSVLFYFLELLLMVVSECLFNDKCTFFKALESWTRAGTEPLNDPYSVSGRKVGGYQLSFVLD